MHCDVQKGILVLKIMLQRFYCYSTNDQFIL